MGCTSCSTTGTPNGCKSNGACGSGSCNKLNVFDWLSNMETPAGQKPFPIVEVRFKNGRKEFFKNETDEPIHTGDVLAVESTSGHDIGVVSLSGELVRLQLRKRGIKVGATEFKRIFRKAHQQDIERWQVAREREQGTMIRSRKIVSELGLSMKIGDVEFQGDNSKATFYYTADDRVDFRELIRILADEFKARIEMRQIGYRQEAGRIGGIGTCGRELCCSTWLSDFRSVTTSAARYQQLSLNPLKLSGQCGRLKCCLNYELDSYMDALKDFPKNHEKLATAKGTAFLQKTDIFRKILWYAYSDDLSTFIALSVERVKELQAQLEAGKTPEALLDYAKMPVAADKSPDFENVVGQDSLTRFDKKGKSSAKNKRSKPRQGSRPVAEGPERGPAQPNTAGATRPQPGTNTPDSPRRGEQGERSRNPRRRPERSGDNPAKPAGQTAEPSNQQNRRPQRGQGQGQGNDNANPNAPRNPARQRPPRNTAAGGDKNPEQSRQSGVPRQGPRNRPNPRTSGQGDAGADSGNQEKG